MSKPRVDQDAPNLTHSEARSSFSSLDDEGHNRGTTFRNRSQSSLYSYRSQDVLRFVVEIDGRTFNSTSDLYLLPSDEREWSRLNNQHGVLLEVLGGLFPDYHATQTILAPASGPAKAVLDLGCGTSAWCTQLARQFPQVTVIGVDLAPCSQFSDTAPANCHFELDNIDLGLSHYFGQFDLVHARCVTLGIADYSKLVEDATLCLKPGGMLVLGEFDWLVYKDDKATPVPRASDDEPGAGSWLQRVFYESKVAAGRNGSRLFPELFDRGLWALPAMEPASCRAASLFLPIGVASPGSTVEARVGAINVEILKNLHRALHRLLRTAGHSQETVDRWSALADEELDSANTRCHWLRFALAWGRTRSPHDSTILDDSPISHDAKPSTTSSNAESTSQHGPEGDTSYPHFLVYRTELELTMATSLRSRGQ